MYYSDTTFNTCFDFFIQCLLQESAKGSNYNEAKVRVMPGRAKPHLIKKLQPTSLTPSTKIKIQLKTQKWATGP
jgi:hypothetical protein